MTCHPPATTSEVHLTRRSLLATFGSVGLVLAPLGWGTLAQAQELDSDLLFNDPASPVGGNPEGSLTMVTFFDYNCPFCRRAAGPLADVVAADGDVRLIYKEWPILTEASVEGAALALSAYPQGRYETAYKALMNLEGRADAALMRQAIEATDIDLDRLDMDLSQNRATIEDALARNLTIAEALGLRGTPAYIIGPYLVGSALDREGFEQVIKDARKRGDAG